VNSVEVIHKENYDLYSAKIKQVENGGTYNTYIYIVRSDSKEIFRKDGERYDNNDKFIKKIDTSKEVSAEYWPNEWDSPMIDRIVEIGKVKNKNEG